MDFIKKFFENIYLYFTSTITGYVGALWLTLRHPILGPQYLAHAHKVEKPVIDPILFMFLTACLFMSNIFAFDLSRSDVLGPLTAGKAGPKLYLIALSALTFTVAITAVFAVLRAAVRTRHARYQWPTNGKTLRRALRRRRVVQLPKEHPIAARRLSALPYALPATILYMLGLLFILLKIPILTDALFVRTFNFIANLFPANAINIEFYALTDFAVPFSLSYGIILAIWVLTLAFTPAFLPVARALFFPARLITRLTVWRKIGLVLGAAILSTTVFVASWTGMAAYFWLSGPKAVHELSFSDLVCDLRNLPDVTAAVHFKNQHKGPLVMTQDAISIVPMKRSKVREDGSYWTERLTGVIPMRIDGLNTQKRSSFYAIPADSQGLITLQGYFDQEEPFELEEGMTLICGLEISSYQVNDDTVKYANWALEGRVLIPHFNR